MRRLARSGRLWEDYIKLFYKELYSANVSGYGSKPHLCDRKDMIYLLSAIGQPPGGSSTVDIYTQTIHRTTQNKQYIEQHKNFGRVRAVPHLCGFYPGICPTTEEEARKNLSQVCRRMPAGTMKIHKHTIRINRHNKNI